MRQAGQFYFLHIIYKENSILIEFYKTENRIFAAQMRNIPQNGNAKPRL